jgi:hypothetical protein
MFWKACGHKKCLRAQACVVDGRACFDLLWPIVPEVMKVGIRAAIKAMQAGLSLAETEAETQRELERWHAANEPRAGQTLPQAPELPQSAPIMHAPSSPRATGPRLRVL